MPLRRLRTRPPLRWSPTLARLPALTVHQPYAWLIVHGYKDIENRPRPTHHRGPILIHAGLNTDTLDHEEWMADAEATAEGRLPDDLARGGVIGVVEIVGCVRRSSSEWKEPASWGWQLAHARPLRFRPCKGALGFFRPKWTAG